MSLRYGVSFIDSAKCYLPWTTESVKSCRDRLCVDTLLKAHLAFWSMCIPTSGWEHWSHSQSQHWFYLQSQMFKMRSCFRSAQRQYSQKETGRVLPPPCQRINRWLKPFWGIATKPLCWRRVRLTGEVGGCFYHFAPFSLSCVICTILIPTNQQRSKWILFCFEKISSIVLYSILFYHYFYLGMILFRSWVTDNLLGYLSFFHHTIGSSQDN